MTDNPYIVVGSPNYAAPIVDLFGNKPTQQGQGQQGQTFTQALQQFLNGANGQQMLAPGSAIPGAVGPTSVGGSDGPMPLMASGGSPTMDPTMIGSLF